MNPSQEGQRNHSTEAARDGVTMSVNSRPRAQAAIVGQRAAILGARRSEGGVNVLPAGRRLSPSDSCFQESRELRRAPAGVERHRLPCQLERSLESLPADLDLDLAV